MTHLVLLEISFLQLMVFSRAKLPVEPFKLPFPSSLNFELPLDSAGGVFPPLPPFTSSFPFPPPSPTPTLPASSANPYLSLNLLKSVTVP